MSQTLCRTSLSKIGMLASALWLGNFPTGSFAAIDTNKISTEDNMKLTIQEKSLAKELGFDDTALTLVKQVGGSDFAKIDLKLKNSASGRWTHDHRNPISRFRAQQLGQQPQVFRT